MASIGLCKKTHQTTHYINELLIFRYQQVDTWPECDWTIKHISSFFTSLLHKNFHVLIFRYQQVTWKLFEYCKLLDSRYAVDNGLTCMGCLGREQKVRQRLDTWPKCDSDPGTTPNHPSKFMQARTNSTALSTSTASSLPYKPWTHTHTHTHIHTHNSVHSNSVRKYIP